MEEPRETYDPLNPGIQGSEDPATGRTEPRPSGPVPEGNNRFAGVAQRGLETGAHMANYLKRHPWETALGAFVLGWLLGRRRGS